jgi:hypothetical protein
MSNWQIILVCLFGPTILLFTAFFMYCFVVTVRSNRRFKRMLREQFGGMR